MMKEESAPVVDTDDSNSEQGAQKYGHSISELHDRLEGTFPFDVLQRLAENDDNFSSLLEIEDDKILLHEVSKRLISENQRLTTKATEAQREIAELKQQYEKNNFSPSLLENKTRQNLVLCPSIVSKDPELRNEFRKNQVALEPCRGGFIAQEFYLHFVLAARECDKHKLEEQKKKKVVDAVTDLGEVLSRSARKKYSLFNNGYLDEESPQSAVGCELFRLALDMLSESDSSDQADQLSSARMYITHQHNLVTDIKEMKDGSSLPFDIIRKKKRGRDAKPKEPEEEKKALDQIDICAWFVHPDEALGACVLAACEYKPNNTAQVEREAQADMYGSNILILHRKQCIIIDIAGANELDNWNVSAHGLVKADFSSEPHTWEKTPLYSGKGAEAIVLVSQGLLQAKKFFPKKLDDYGDRLGPVVGIIDNDIYKVYDNAEFRKPNIGVIKHLLDKNADLFESKDKKLFIVKMKKMESDWKSDKLNSKVFQNIIKKLQLLHKEYGPHGDIRLANLLSCGEIIDFDFVGADLYPYSLQMLDQDGKRHPDVEKMIKSISETGFGHLKPATEHDWFSLAHVMRLFQPREKKNGKNWKQRCSAVEQGRTDDSNVNYLIELNDKTIPLRATGHTPDKKQPVSNKLKKRRLGQPDLPQSAP